MSKEMEEYKNLKIHFSIKELEYLQNIKITFSELWELPKGLQQSKEHLL